MRNVEIELEAALEKLRGAAKDLQKGAREAQKLAAEAQKELAKYLPGAACVALGVQRVSVLGAAAAVAECSGANLCVGAIASAEVSGGPSTACSRLLLYAPLCACIGLAAPACCSQRVLSRTWCLMRRVTRMTPSSGSMCWTRSCGS